MRFASLVAAGLAAALAAPAAAQVPRLTVDNIYASNEFSGDLVSVRWMADGEHFTRVERVDDGATDLHRINARTGIEQRIIDGTELVPRGADQPIRIERYTFSPDGRKLLIFTNSQRVWRQRTKGEYYVWDFVMVTLTPISLEPGYQMFAKFSPDGRYVGFVRDNNLFATNLQSGQERQLTHDGSENVINGTSDWVYEEELGLRDAFRWSPDGRRIAFWRFDQTVIKPFYLIDETQLYPELLPVRYPKAGEQNSEVRIGVVEVEGGSTTWMDLGPNEDIYIADMGFTDNPREIWFTRLNRNQNRIELVIGNTRTGSTGASAGIGTTTAGASALASPAGVRIHTIRLTARWEPMPPGR